ncbi:MAG: hypothetical protein ACLVEJ_12400 [Parabacteroides sp.]
MCGWKSGWLLRPRISEVNYHGIKKGEREDLEARLGLKKGFQVTPNLMDRAKIVIQKFFFWRQRFWVNACDVDIVSARRSLSKESEVIVAYQ